MDSDIANLVKIDFPYGLSKRGVKDLFSYLNKLDGFNFTYVVEKELHFSEHLSQSIISHKGGNVTYKHLIEPFTFIESEPINRFGPREVLGMNFSPIPGYSLQEHGEDRIRLWRYVGAQASNFR